VDHPLVLHLKYWFTRLQRLIYGRTVLILVVLLCAGIASGFVNLTRLSSELVESQARQNAILYSEAITEARTLYSNVAVDRIRDSSDVVVTEDYHHQTNAIPIPATFLIELGQRITANSPELSVRLYSDYPFPQRQETGGPRDRFEQEALTYLRRYPDQFFYRFETLDGQRVFRFAQADRMQQSCVDCHNIHPNSPKRDWRVGDVRGILEITQPLNSITMSTWHQLRGNQLVLVTISLAAIAGVSLVIARLRQTSKELELRVIERTAKLQEMNERLAEEQEKSERLLLNILPMPIAQRLKEHGSGIADGFADVTILFADLVNFTELSEQFSPNQLVTLLNEIFSSFDALSERYGLEKIKTIGDAYMVAGGIPTPRNDHAEAIAEMAIAMRSEICRLSQKFQQPLELRIGINTGPIVAGVIGQKKFAYDLWGDTVNLASRMESQGVPGTIQVTEATYQRLKKRYQFEPREPIVVKGKGKMTTYFLTARQGEVAQTIQTACPL
jgi:adenylate cyclase